MTGTLRFVGFMLAMFVVALALIVLFAPADWLTNPPLEYHR